MGWRSLRNLQIGMAGWSLKRPELKFFAGGDGAPCGLRLLGLRPGVWPTQKMNSGFCSAIVKLFLMDGPPFPLSSQAKPRDLQFYRLLVEMFSNADSGEGVPR